MQSADRATGKDIILDILENMRAYQEQLLYSSMVPTSFEVHLHPDDFDRLEGIFPAIASEARRALDEELARQNRRVGPEWLRKLTQSSAPAQAATDGWAIAFCRDEDGELTRGEVLIDSRLTLPQAPELGAGTRTRRITTSRLGQHTTTKSQIVEDPTPVAVAAAVVEPSVPADADPTTRTTTPALPGSVAESHAAASALVFATLTYEDKGGRHVHPVTEAQLVIGRGGAGYWVDVRVDAAPDISREHVRLRRDLATGTFYLKDVSRYGTTVNGQRIASSIDASDGGKQDLNLEVALPPQARIGLADMVFLDFRVADAS